MTKEFDETAKELAKAHKAEDPDTHTVLLAPDEQEKEIRLVEVSSSAPAADDIFAVYFESDLAHGIPFPSAVVLLSDQEWEKIQLGELPLPEGWGTSKDLRKLA
jgi:hypothetical protein